MITVIILSIKSQVSSIKFETKMSLCAVARHDYWRAEVPAL